ncbi:hybrid sensor histidine kinase/response regulator [Compostibacter hankyongensis]|uniref:histidine kinase n=1 Tax=Compostibacter hankyongensis TaxID=1007089 RepID=A0ABP8FP54_9BACT
MNHLKDIIRVLIVDDDEDDYFITSEYLREIESRHFHTDWCYRYEDALSHIRERTHDIYLVDYRLGAQTGLDLLKAAMERGCEEPIVLLTGKGNKVVDNEAMATGATDYLIKTELNAEKLERCIRYSLDRSSSLKALRANERKYRGVFERSKDAVFIASSTLQFLDVNEAATQLSEYSREALLAMKLPDLIPGRQQQAQLYDILAETGEINDYETDLAGSGGQKKHCIISATQERDLEGGIYVHGIIHDITNLRQAQKARLQVEKLAAAGRLVRTLAHEVRNPLNNINMSVEQLNGEMQDEENRVYLDIISRNSKRIGDLISELLDSSLPSEVTLRRISLQNILDESMEVASDRIRLQKILLQRKYPDKAVYIRADKGKLKLAFQNIIINAIEAMESENRMLDVEILPGKERHTVAVRDSGCGISEEHLTRLFEPYFTAKRNGMGLGLSTSFNIFQSHLAHIDVSSTPGSGTVFTISFPVVTP